MRFYEILGEKKERRNKTTNKEKNKKWNEMKMQSCVCGKEYIDTHTHIYICTEVLACRLIKLYEKI